MSVAPVSVIIPTKDRGGLVSLAVESILSLEGQPAEVVVVDCNSQDHTEARLSGYGDRIRIIRGGFPNAATARNVGANETSSEFLGFLDSDDLALPGKTTCLVDAMRRSSSLGLLHGDVRVIDGGGNTDVDATRTQMRDRSRAERLGTTYEKLAEFCSMYTSATLIRRTAFEDVSGYDEALDTYEDLDFYLRLSLRWEIEYADCLAAEYRVWEQNVPWDRTAAGVIAVAEKHLRDAARLPAALRRRARFGLLERAATAHHSLVRQSPARRAATAAFLASPIRAVRSRALRRAFFASFLPADLLEGRRPSRGEDAETG